MNTTFAVPFPADYRASGILLHVASLPSPYGIGDLGPAALAWIDRLHEAGQTWWQALPLGPTGYGNSPYQPLSSFAGNELLFSPEALIEDGLLRAGDCPDGTSSAAAIDYVTVIPFKRRLLETAWINFQSGARPELRPSYDEYRHEQKAWLEDYALFRALKRRYEGAHYAAWPVELARRDPGALGSARREFAEPIEQICFAQFLLSHQGGRVKRHAQAKGVHLLGDLPFFVASDSSDVWANPELFLLDARGNPRFVAGVPPDYFSAHGQLWGNPVYDWEALRQNGYRWWIERLRTWASRVDMIRLDHFRAFAAAWHVPATAATAERGDWTPGPGAALFRAAETELGSLPFLAEDLGVITPDVTELRLQFRLPGTRVLQFGFDGKEDNPHLPGNFEHNTVVYTGTHDNPTTRAWFEDLPAHQRQNLWNHIGRPPGDSRDAAPAMIDLAWSSAAALAIVPLQDILNLGSEAQMNVPGRAEDNWRWRCTEAMLEPAGFRWLHELTRDAKRAIDQHC